MKLPANFEKGIQQLYAGMDQAFDRSAGQAGFVCNGCKENCCRTRFYHHTLVELLYLGTGLAALPSPDRFRLMDKARQVCAQSAEMDRRGRTVRVMCPLNENQRCLLYAHRPMICRLHGIPHGLRRPDGQVVTGPGCDDYDRQCGRSAASPLDRTPLYMALSALERKLRGQLNFSQKIKLTVAEMIIQDNEIY